MDADMTPSPDTLYTTQRDHVKETIEEVEREYYDELHKAQLVDPLCSEPSFLQNFTTTSRSSPDILENAGWDDTPPVWGCLRAFVSASLPSYQAVAPISHNVRGADYPNDLDIFYLPFADKSSFIEKRLIPHVSKSLGGDMKPWGRRLDWVDRPSPDSEYAITITVSHKFFILYQCSGLKRRLFVGAFELL